MPRKTTDWDTIIKKWNYVFDEKLNKDTYENFKEVFPDLLNKAGQINSKIIRTEEFQKTKLYNDVNTRINFNDFPFYAKIRCIQEGLTQPLTCCCGGTLSYSPQDSYYKRFCGPTCGTSHPDTQAKVNKTNQLKYGCNWSTQSQQMKNKSVATKQIHYNADHHMQNPEYYKKYKNELEVQTGYSNNFSNPTCKEKIKQTNKKIRGVENPQQYSYVRAKLIATNIANYGCAHYFQTEEFQQKFRKTMLDRYNAPHPMLIDEFVIKQHDSFFANNDNINKILETFRSNNQHITIDQNITYNGRDTEYTWIYKECGHSYTCKINSSGIIKLCPICYNIGVSKMEKDMGKYIASQLYDQFDIIYNERKLIKPFELDVYIPSLNIAFEFNGTFWHSAKPSDYHENKSKWCEERDVILYHISENDWTNNHDITLDYIREKIMCALNDVDAHTIEWRWR